MIDQFLGKPCEEIPMITRFVTRLPLVLVCLIGVSATGPQSAVVQVFDQRGLPVEGAVIEVPPPAGSTRPLAFPWRSAMAQRSKKSNGADVEALLVDGKALLSIMAALDGGDSSPKAAKLMADFIAHAHTE